MTYRKNTILQTLLGALLCAALCAPAAAAGTDTVFTVDKAGITYTVDQLSTAWRTEIPQQTKLEYVSQQGWQARFVDNWIQVAIMSHLAQQKKLQDDPEFQLTWHIRESSLLASKFFEHTVAPELAMIKPTDQDIKDYYEENKDSLYFTGWREASHIIVTDQKLADDLYAQLSKKPDAFADLAKKNSIDEDTKEAGGALGRVTGQDKRIPPEVLSAYLTTPVGKVSKPAQSRLGWHIVHVTAASKSGEDYRPLDDKLKQEISTLANAEKQQEAALNIIQKHLKALDIEINEQAVPDIARDWVKDMQKLTGTTVDEPDDGTAPDPDTVVATLKKPGIQITLHELDVAWTEEMNDSFKSQLITRADWQRMFVDRWVEIVALAYLARVNKLDQKPEFKDLAKIKRDSLLATMYFKKILGPEMDKIPATDEEIKAWYDQNRETLLYAGWREASHILVQSKDKIDEIYAALQKDPGKFEQLAKENSIDPGSKDKGGALGRVQKGQFVPEAERAVFSTPVGQMSEPVQTQFGWHIFKVTAASDPKDDYLPLNDEIKEQIRARVLSEKRRTAFLDIMQKYRGEMDVKVNETVIGEIALDWVEEMKKKLPPMSPQQ